MNEQIHLKVDLANQDDIAAKLEDAEAILKDKRQVAEEANAEAEHWADLVGRLRSFHSIEIDESGMASGRPAPAQDAVVRIVQREGRQMRPVEVSKALKAEGHKPMSNDAVNAALYAAAQAGRLRRPKDRHYAPKKG
jgi:hypothetical protein